MSKRGKKRVPMKLPLLILLDVVMVGVALLIFALFHHVIPHRQDSLGIVSTRPGAVYAMQEAQAPVEAGEEPAAQPQNEAIPGAAQTEDGLALWENDAQESVTAVVPVTEATTAAETTASPTPTAAPTATPAPTEEPVVDVTLEPTPTPEPVGYFGTKFKSMFCEAGGAKNGNNYQSANTNITIYRKKVGTSYVCVADIYIRDISNLITVFAKDTYGHGISEWPPQMAKRIGALVTLSGDYYGAHSDGIVIRNGTVYRSTNSSGADVCVLYWDGVMETFSPKEFDLQAAVDRGVYQAWCFGPELLDAEGHAMTKFNSSLTGANPRAAIGYFEPGHYCFVMVEGRNRYSEGMTLKELSATMEMLGCAAAYNLDGGATAMLLAGTEYVNERSDLTRPSSDAIMIVNDPQ